MSKILKSTPLRILIVSLAAKSILKKGCCRKFYRNMTRAMYVLKKWIHMQTFSWSFIASIWNLTNKNHLKCQLVEPTWRDPHSGVVEPDYQISRPPYQPSLWSDNQQNVKILKKVIDSISKLNKNKLTVRVPFDSYRIRRFTKQFSRWDGN